MAYNMFGIRVENREYNVGDEFPKSRKWDMGVVTDELLNGTSVLFVSCETDFTDYLDGKLDADYGELDLYKKAIELSKSYNGDHIYLVGIESQWGYETGEDEQEYVFNGAEVVRRIK